MQTVKIPQIKQKKYNHAFVVAFSIESNNDGEHVTERELLIGLTKRLLEFLEAKVGHTLASECCGMPYDTYENY